MRSNWREWRKKDTFLISKVKKKYEWVYSIIVAIDKEDNNLQSIGHVDKYYIGDASDENFMEGILPTRRTWTIITYLDYNIGTYPML